MERYRVINWFSLIMQMKRNIKYRMKNGSQSRFRGLIAFKVTKKKKKKEKITNNTTRLGDKSLDKRTKSS